MCAKTLWPLASSTRNMAFGSGSMTRPSISMAPSFFGMSSAVRDVGFTDRRITTVSRPGTRTAPAAAPTPTEALVGTPGWTLCADPSVYARVAHPPNWPVSAPGAPAPGCVAAARRTGPSVPAPARPPLEPGLATRVLQRLADAVDGVVLGHPGLAGVPVPGVVAEVLAGGEADQGGDHERDAPRHH